MDTSARSSTGCNSAVLPSLTTPLQVRKVHQPQEADGRILPISLLAGNTNWLLNKAKSFKVLAGQCCLGANILYAAWGLHQILELGSEFLTSPPPQTAHEHIQWMKDENTSSSPFITLGLHFSLCPSHGHHHELGWHHAHMDITGVTCLSGGPLPLYFLWGGCDGEHNPPSGGVHLQRGDNDWHKFITEFAIPNLDDINDWPELAVLHVPNPTPHPSSSHWTEKLHLPLCLHP
ncbi:uncharacterized protein EI90DRAFT_3020858 [Cantharellus anzutake]|uniref:uncharacterized protein n=1 Tax=Cantharellus anzutake TaxID=1750568 RepID=UPI001904A43A|nr:uncharacterized protein EI90DRAFT_3020858 [Cantharellus anzutake]KAF8319154.1 hypothetical protein EI90DRAFT_3020858 [Cantharellus anzutake]